MLLSPIGFYTIHVRTIRFASGPPSGWKVFESLDPLDSRILGKEKSEFSRESSISRIGNRFFREVSFSIGENFRELSKIRRRIDF